MVHRTQRPDGRFGCLDTCIRALSIATPLLWAKCDPHSAAISYVLAQVIILLLALAIADFVPGLVARSCPGLRGFTAVLCNAGKAVSVALALGNLALHSWDHQWCYDVRPAGMTLPLLGPVFAIVVFTVAFSPALVWDLLLDLLLLAGAGLAVVCLSLAAGPVFKLPAVLLLVAGYAVLIPVLHWHARHFPPVWTRAVSPSIATEAELLERLQHLNECMVRLRDAASAH
jgi:hypothetical protein